MAPPLCFAFASSSPSYEGSAAYDSSSVTSKSCGFACQHAQLPPPSSTSPNTPPPPPNTFDGQQPGSRLSFLPPFKHLNLGIATAYLAIPFTEVKSSQMVWGHGRRPRVPSVRWDQTWLKVDTCGIIHPPLPHHHPPKKNTRKEHNNLNQ